MPTNTMKRVKQLADLKHGDKVKYESPFGLINAEVHLYLGKKGLIDEMGASLMLDEQVIKEWKIFK